MSKSNVIELEGREASIDPLSELLQTGAQKLILHAVEAELYVCLEQYSDRRTEDGHAGVVRNGYQPEREIQTGIGPVTVKIPKVRAKTGEPVTFRSALYPQAEGLRCGQGQLRKTGDRPRFHQPTIHLPPKTVLV